MRNLTRTCNGIQTEAYSEFQSLAVQKHVPYVPVCQSHLFNGGKFLEKQSNFQNVFSYSTYSEFTFTHSFTKSNDTWRLKIIIFRRQKISYFIIQMGNLFSLFFLYEVMYCITRKIVQVPDQTLPV